MARPLPRAGCGYAGSVLAFLPTLGFQEMFMLFLLGILLFGRNLPDVGRKVGRTVQQLRRGMSEFKAQMDRDDSVRELRDTIRDTRDEVRRAGAIPRAMVNPAAAVRDYANETVRDAFNNGDDGQAAARGIHDPLRGDESHRAAHEEAPIDPAQGVEHDGKRDAQDK